MSNQSRATVILLGSCLWAQPLEPEAQGQFCSGGGRDEDVEGPDFRLPQSLGEPLRLWFSLCI